MYLYYRTVIKDGCGFGFAHNNVLARAREQHGYPPAHCTVGSGSNNVSLHVHCTRLRQRISAPHKCR